MNNRKIFIGISLDEKTKKFISQKVQFFESFPVNFVALENYHLTLKYLGFISDEEIYQICQRLKEKLSQIGSFDISFVNFIWGPTNENPRMIWLRGKKSNELINLQKLVEEAVLNQNQLSRKSFLPHITIARIRKKDLRWQNWQKRKLEKNSFIFPSIKVLVPVSSVEIFESKKEKRERKYYILESIALK